jgi:hypothetical protein
VGKADGFQKTGKGADVSYQPLFFDFFFQVGGNVGCQCFAK